MMTPVDSWISGRYSFCWYIVGMGMTSVAASTDCKLAFLNECLLTIVIHLQSFVFAVQTSLLSASSVYSCPFCNLCFFKFESLCKLCFELCKAFLWDSCKSLYFEALQCVCVCVRERESERERERERESVCVCELSIAAGGIIIVMASTLTIDLQRAIVYPYRRGTKRDHKKLVNITQDLCFFLLVSFVLLLLL
jgi:hypothetical protein